MNAPNPLQRCNAAYRDQRGSATVEMVLLTPVLILMLLFIVLCGRLASGQLRIDDAAHQAARSASIARSVSEAQTEANATAQAALANAGMSCRNLTVAVDTGGLRPGSTVNVDLDCEVGLSDLAMLGVPGSTTLSASFSSPVDTYRSVPIEGGA